MNLLKLRQIIILTIVLTLTSSVEAQSLEPSVSTVHYDDDVRPSLSVVVAPEPKELKKAWRDYMKEQYDIRLKGVGLFSNKDVLTADEVTIAELSSDAMDFHTKVIEVEDGTRMDVFAAHGYDIYVSPEVRPAEFVKLDMMMQGFLNSYIPKHYAERVEEKKEIVADLTDEKESQQENILSMREEISELKEEMDSIEKDLEETSTDLEKTNTELNNEQNELSNLKRKLESVQ